MSKKIIVTERDYALISKYINYNPKKLSNYSYLRLSKELNEANIVTGDKIPPGVIGLNSEITLFEKTLHKQLNIQLVLPSRVDSKNNKISIFSPLGIVLIGYHEGDVVEWEVNGAVRQYEVLQVINS